MNEQAHESTTTAPISAEASTAAPEAAVTERPAPGELTEAGLEALLFVAERPLSRREIGAIAGVDAATVDARLGDLEVALRDRGLRLLAVGDRVELATSPETGALVARYVGTDAVRLSPAGLETLAIVAYRQPVTKAAVERVRGVDSDYTIRSLLHRRLLVELDALRIAPREAERDRPAGVRDGGRHHPPPVPHHRPPRARRSGVDRCRDHHRGG